ncbi:MAG: hypothetical protein ACFE9R_02240 [Candidatus Hermodarchaeota archaeon]
MTVEDYKNFISEIKKKKMYDRTVDEVLLNNYPIVNKKEQCIYFIESSSENFFKNVKYPHSVISMLRLFADGDIPIPLEFNTAVIEGGKLIEIQSSTQRLTYFTYYPLFHLNDENIVDANKFINKFQFPLEKKWIQLAVENFDQSYKSIDNNLSFLSLMICLEALFNPGEYELKYRISRNIAVFLGKYKNMDSKKIFTDIKDLYDKRSKIVHTGKNDVIDSNNLSTLRKYVRESIKKMIELDENKDELLKELNTYGFN